MNVAVVYTYPLIDTRLHFPLAKRFAETLRSHPAGYPHSFFIGCNGRKADPMDIRPFAGMDFMTIHHDNSGWDIGLYQKAAAEIPCDLLVCLGAHISFNHRDWLKMLVDAMLAHGPGLYGPWGTPFPTPHIRTTAFACPPELLQSYPLTVGSDRASRYQFEHGHGSFTAHTLDIGFPCVMVTTKGLFPYPDWQDNAPTAAESILLDKQHT